MILLDRVCGVLTRNGVAHALIDAAALAARGIARSTFDINLLTTDARVLDRDLWTSLMDDFTVDVQRGDAADPLGGVVRVDGPSERPVDIILGNYPWQTRAVERADSMPSGPYSRVLHPYAGRHGAPVECVGSAES